MKNTNTNSKLIEAIRLRLNSYTIEAIRSLLKSKNIGGYSKLNKAQLIEYTIHKIDINTLKEELGVSISDSEKKKIWKKVRDISLIIGLVASVFAIARNSDYFRLNYFLKKSEISYICSDEVLGIKIMETFKGPFYNADRYDFFIEITNNSDINIYISEIRVFFRSKKVTNEVPIYSNSIKNKSPSIPDDTYYISQSLPLDVVFLPEKKDTLYIRGPIFLPENIEIFAFHSANFEGTHCIFNIDQSSDKSEASKSLQATLEYKSLGFDVLSAIKEAIPLAREKFGKTQAISILPADYSTKMLPNGLHFDVIDLWAIYCKTTHSNIAGYILIDKNGIRSWGYDTLDNNSRYYGEGINLTQIKFGTFEALRKVDNLELIYNNSPHNWGLLSGINERGLELPIWRLPYLVRDYLNLFINAQTGDLLSSIQYHEQLAPFEKSSTTRVDKNDEAEYK